MNTSSSAAAESSGTAISEALGPEAPSGGGRLRTLWNGLTGAVGVVTGLAPHVLHHVGLLAGTALVAGAGGTALFGVIGVVASIPMLRRLKRRFRSWWAPAIALAVFAVMFSVSAFVVGPRISGVDAGSDTGPAAPTQTVDHSGHHQP